MNISEFNDILKKKILILDGATGTELQKRGMPKGVCPEEWVIQNPEKLIEIQKKYVDSGSNVVYACTFGANRAKLEEFGLEDKVYEFNKELAGISRKAVGDNGYVAGDMAPTGKFVEPFGELAFEDAVDIYKEQARGLIDGKVDFFIIETMIDIQETRAALIAVKELCDLPVIVSMTFSKDGYTLTGTDPISALITLQSLGADAVGCNCSTGPDDMVKVIEKIKPYSKVPLIAKPNAGMPKLVNGETVFDMSAKEYGEFMPRLLEAGVNLLGGCCGTSFDYIKEIRDCSKGFKPIQPKVSSISAVSSPRNYAMPGIGKPLSIVGERINPTGKKKLQAELREGIFDEVKRFAAEQTEAGAAILDVNMGMSGIDEKEMMLKAIKLLVSITSLPLAIDSSDPDVIEAALRVYPGRALVNSISAEVKKLKHLLPIVAKYGAMFILLPLNDDTIPATSDERQEIIKEIFEEAQKYGYAKEDIAVDGLVMTVSSDQNAAKETLKLINWCARDYNINTIVGLSNVSFGLPFRKYVNASFLSMAIGNGLSMAIANPCEDILSNAKFASDVLVGNDEGSRLYINHFADVEKVDTKTVKDATKTPLELIYDYVVAGEQDKVVDQIKIALDAGEKVGDIVDNYLIKAINKVGDLYEKKVYFLPQLIASAETMKTAFNYLEPFLSRDDGESKNKNRIILATVKGDIHDIGKNIVGLMFKNYGFEVIDLGKDVSSEKIVEEAIKSKADVIGLSALMTTTMQEMKTVVLLAKERKCNSKIIIGGAVITEDYAKEIEADGYAPDGIAAVKLVNRLLAVDKSA